MVKHFIVAIVAGALLSFGASASGDEPDADRPPGLNQRSEADYYRPPTPERYEPDTRAIIRQKAMLRAQQRQARLEANNWYEMSSARPTVPVLWRSMYFPASFPAPYPAGRFRWPRADLEYVTISTGASTDQAHAAAGRVATDAAPRVR